MKWGSVRRGARLDGTWHFYTDDGKFSALWAKPDAVPLTSAVAAVEPNYSTMEQSPTALLIHDIYRKRWLARYWQSCGMTILVDLNVTRKAEKLNLTGVPRGWFAYATRGYSDRPQEIIRQLEIAKFWSKRQHPLMLVCGGGAAVEQLCKKYGLVYAASFALDLTSEAAS